MKQYIKAEAFNRSIELALNSSINTDEALQRIKRTIAALPPDKLYHGHHNGWISFYKRINGKQVYLSKASNEVYLLARRRYLLLLQSILELTNSRDEKSINARRDLIKEIQKLVCDYASGNLDIARIVMTPKQYKWFISPFPQKTIDKSIAYESSGGIFVRSKSERDIMHSFEAFAVPAHYEERTQVDVQLLVEALYAALKKAGKLNGTLFYFSNGACRWHVPKELEWMNSPGSLWSTYSYRTGKITIFDDFKIMLANNELLIWEHLGMCSDFIYRSSAGERSMVLRYTKAVPRGNLIETFEHEVDSTEKITEILAREVLPRLWF